MLAVENVVADKHTIQTGYYKMIGDTMVDAGIYDGDTLIVDKHYAQPAGKIIIAKLNGKMLVRKFQKVLNVCWLIPCTPLLSSIQIDDTAQFEITGVVTHVIHRL